MDILRYVRAKTPQTLKVKIEACMQEILTRYESQTVDDYLLPVYTDQNRDNESQLRNHNNRLGMKNKQLIKPLRRRRITWITPCKRSAARGRSVARDQNSIPLRRRRITWITPCKRSAARGIVAAHYPSNSVGVQPTTGLLVRVHFVPRAATLSGVARGYPRLSPTDFFCYNLFNPCHLKEYKL